MARPPVRPTIARPRARAADAELRVAVNCCTCGKPTSLRVPPALLLEVDIQHLCTTCAREEAEVGVGDPAGAGR